MKKSFPLLDFRCDEKDDESMIKSLIHSLSNIGFVAIKISHKQASIVKKTQSFAKRTFNPSIHLTNNDFKNSPFFNNKTEELDSLKKTDKDHHHPRKGYSPYESENFACLLGRKRPNDRVIKYRYVNSEPESELDDTLKTCFEMMKSISERVLRMLAKGLKLKEDYWISSQENVSTLTANYYPCREEDDELDMQEHTDVDFITLVCSDEEGLEIEWSDGTWTKAPFGSDVLILNVADALSEWPGLSGTFRSTRHRVKCSSSSTGRLSLAFFVAPHPRTKMCDPFEGESEDTLTYKKWRRRRIARALKALKQT